MSTKELDQSNRDRKIYQVLASIPFGRVASYGQIAELADIPYGARIVGRTLANLPGQTRLPWHRIINHHGKISLLGEAGLLQKKLLEQEGILFANGRIDLTRFRWCP